MTPEQLRRFETELKRDRDRRARLAAEAEKVGKLEASFIHEDYEQALTDCLRLLHLHSDGEYGEPWPTDTKPAGGELQ